MNGRAKKRPRVKSSIQASLARSVASGEVPVGRCLPTEAELCTQYGVSRTALREAIKGLEAKGMLRSKPRIGTFVLPREEWAILDADVLEWISDLLDQEAFVDAVLEARHAIEPAAAALACSHASLADLSRIEDAINGMEQSTQNPDAFTEADLAFHEALLRASHNMVFLRLIHSVRAGLRQMLSKANHSVDDYSRTIGDHRALLEAMVARDEVRAANAARRIIDAARGVIAGIKLRGSPNASA